MVDHNIDNQDDAGPGGPGGATVAIGVLVLILILLLFLFREQLGFGSPSMEISIPDRFEADVPATTEDLPAPAEENDETDSAN